jgi:hypothetical protein
MRRLGPAIFVGVVAALCGCGALTSADLGGNHSDSGVDAGGAPVADAGGAPVADAGGAPVADAGQGSLDAGAVNPSCDHVCCVPLAGNVLAFECEAPGVGCTVYDGECAGVDASCLGGPSDFVSSSRSTPPPAFPSQFAPCQVSSDCGCALVCKRDPSFAQQYPGDAGACEQPCTTSGDCSDPQTVCRSGACTLNFCALTLAGQAAPGQFGKACDADGNPGVCQVVYANDNYGISYGICLQSGTATAACTVGATRAAPGARCAQGSLCLGDTYDACSSPGADGGAPFCEQVCDVSQPGSCPAGKTCTVWAPELPQGNCGPPPSDTFGLCR